MLAKMKRLIYPEKANQLCVDAATIAQTNEATQTKIVNRAEPTILFTNPNCYQLFD